MAEGIELGQSSGQERKFIESMHKTLLSGVIFEEELISNVHVFLKRQTLSRLLQHNETYQHILRLPGCIMQCGVRWGADLVTFASLRTIYEPFNYSRRIIGFDTFSGLKGTSHLDQGSHLVADGQLNVSEGYVKVLDRILTEQAEIAPIPHIKKHQLIVGDATHTVPNFLDKNKGEMIALLYLDMDLHKPTLDVLEACASRLVKGAVVVFDEYGSAQFPGEALAAREFSERMGLRMVRSPFSTVGAYGIKED